MRYLGSPHWPFYPLIPGLLLSFATLTVMVSPIFAGGVEESQSPTLASPVQSQTSAKTRYGFQRILIIVLENQDYEDVIADPYFQTLAQRGASLTNFHGLFHPSYQNYLAMVAGKTIPTDGDHQIDIDGKTIADLLGARGFTWKNYAEGYPTDIDPAKYPKRCFTASELGRYRRKHVPFASFRRIQDQACDKIVPGQDFAADFKNAALPTYAFYSPDMDDDGHDPKDQAAVGLAKAATWLRGFLAPLLDNAAFMRDTLTIVTFDESCIYCRRPDTNHIYTVLLGDMVRPGEVPHYYTHFNLLRAIEENFTLGTLADGDGNATPITEVWKTQHGNDQGPASRAMP